jgi:hypothetical protein
MAQNGIKVSQIPPGQVLTYYGDIASGAIRPEDVRIEALTFRAVIDNTGSVVTSSPKVTIISRYNFALRAVYGAVLNPRLAGFAAGLVRFNVREQGRNFNVFKNPVTLSGVTNGGSAVPYEWDGVYITVPGTDLEVEWSVDAALWQTLVGDTRIVEVVLTGDYIACGPQPPA